MSGAQFPLPVFVRACVPAETPMRVYGCCYGLPPPRRGESFTYLRRQHSATARSDQGAISHCPADLLAYPCLHRHLTSNSRRVRGPPEPSRRHQAPCPRGAPGAPPVVADAPPEAQHPTSVPTHSAPLPLPTYYNPISHSFSTAPAGGYGVRRSRPVSTQPPAREGPRVLPRWWPMHPSRRALRRTLPDGNPTGFLAHRLRLRRTPPELVRAYGKASLADLSHLLPPCFTCPSEGARVFISSGTGGRET